MIGSSIATALPGTGIQVFGTLATVCHKDNVRNYSMPPTNNGHPRVCPMENVNYYSMPPRTTHRNYSITTVTTYVTTVWPFGQRIARAYFRFFYVAASPFF